MKNIESNISPLIESLFPGFYQEDGPNFVAFVKAYYEWLDQGGSESRSLLKYRDIDYTVDSFLEHFKYEFLNGLPETTAASKAFLVKHIQDLYKSKGSVESFKLLFRLVYGEDIDVYDPSIDILRPSDGVWTVPQYLECSPSNRVYTFLGQQITGATSGAKAFVENIIRKRIDGRFIDVVYISGILGEFQTGEYITSNNSLVDSPYIVGSLNQITITQGGSNNNIGDLLSISSNSGVGGTARVSAIANATGKVAYSLYDGGYGFQNTSSIIVSTVVMGISNVSGSFYPFQSVVQPLQIYNYNTLSGNSFSILDSVTGYNASNTSVATGYIVSITSNNVANTGNLIISVTGGNWSLANTVRQSSNSFVNATLVSTSNVSATGVLVDSNSTSVGLYSTNGTFYDTAYIKSYIPEPIGKTTTNTNTTTVTGTNTHYLNEVAVGDTLYFRANGAVVGVVNSITTNTSLTLITNSYYNDANATVWRTHYTATANVSGLYNSGSGSTFKIGALTSTETVVVYTDLLSSNNTGGIPFLDMLVDGSNSNVASNGYGFSANSSAGYNSIIGTTLSTNTITIGKIQSISSINPGNNYNVNPIVDIREPLIAGYDKPDRYITLANTNSLFSPGQTLTQDGVITRTVLSMSSNTGAFVQNEGITQLTSAATGTVYSANSTTLIINVLSGVFVSSNNVIGAISGANAAISGVSSTTSQSRATGIIRSISGNTITVEPTTFSYSFVSSSNVYSVDNNGAVQGLGYISSISRDYTHREMAFNAVVNTAVTAANGIITAVEVIDSGFGHSNGVQLTLTGSNTSQLQITGTALDITQGKGTGFWKDNRGKLNSDKYIHDNKYYQEYSYEIRSRLSLNVYSDILKKLLHVAGTELFGNTIIQSEQNITLYTSGVTVSTS
jgi:hypothetical protein